MAKRIQRRRTKGWRMPKGAIYVGRPSKWGNPYYVGRELSPEQAKRAYEFTLLVEDGASLDLSELRGKDLACWCPLDQPCHADVLLELANEPE